jgi:hypothetical protein
MKTLTRILLVITILLFYCSAEQLTGQRYLDDNGRIDMIIVIDPFTDSRSGPEKLDGPEIMYKSGIPDLLTSLECNIHNVYEVEIPENLQNQYGEWNRAAISNNDLARHIWAFDKDEYFILGLLSGSKSLCGMLAGLQHQGPGRKPLKDNRGQEIQALVRTGDNFPLKVGVIWIDSRASFNTPDITLDGDMDGMNLAMAAGQSNKNLRLKAGLNPAISTRYIIMAGVRDVSPYEQLSIDNSFIKVVRFNENIDEVMKNLAELTDIIYVHVDISVLDPAEIQGHTDAYPGGPSSKELSVFLENIFRYPKVAALGMASYPEEGSEKSGEALDNIINGAIKGIKARNIK